MANFLKRFKESSIGSDDKLSDYSSRISAKGDFGRITDFNVIVTSWSNILMTPRRTWTWDPLYGSNLYKYVFEPADKETQTKIRDEVMDSLHKYDPRARILDVSIQFLSNKKGFNVTVTAELDEEYGEITATIDESSYFDFLRT